ncbi:MAG: glucose 1-dehydrogenase [Planctomycetaceae bacterium]
MKAIAVKPRNPNSVHMAELPKPKVTDVPNGRGVLVKVLKVGVDATDREINEGLYGNPPPGYDFLVLGHESFGIVEEVGPNVRHVKPGDYVTCTVRRPGGSIFDRIGHSDMTSEETYYERGINLLHGYMTEYYVDDAEFVIRVPAALKHLGVLAEPMSVAEKAIQQVYEAQRRLQVWEPRVAYVLGSGQIGLLSTLILRMRGVEVYTIARGPKPNFKAEIAEAYGATYVSCSLAELAKQTGAPDLIVEATGNSAIAFDAMNVLGRNGAIVWTSITGGTRKTEVQTDKINLEWVLGNKLLLGSVNANFRHFEAGISDMAQGEIFYPGVTQRILTSPVNGLDNYREMMRLLVEAKDALKVFVNVAEG